MVLIQSWVYLKPFFSLRFGEKGDNLKLIIKIKLISKAWKCRNTTFQLLFLFDNLDVYISKSRNLSCWYTLLQVWNISILSCSILTICVQICLHEICKWFVERRKKTVTLADTYFCWSIHNELTPDLASEVHMERQQLPGFCQGKTLYESQFYQQVWNRCWIIFETLPHTYFTYIVPDLVHYFHSNCFTKCLQCVDIGISWNKSLNND